MSNISNTHGVTVEEVFQRLYWDASEHFTNDTSDNVVDLAVSTSNILKKLDLHENQLDESFNIFLKSLWHIEQFMTEVLASHELAYSWVKTESGKKLINHPLSKYFRSLIKVTFDIQADFTYSDHVELFVACWKQMEMGGLAFTTPKGNSNVKDKMQWEVFNDFITLIRTEAFKPEFKRKVSRTQEKLYRRKLKADQYLQALFTYGSSRLLVLRLDLAYRQNIAQSVTLEQAKVDLNHLYNNRRGNRLFKGWLGYIRKIEWAPQKGLHFHLIVFLNGDDRQQDISIARLIGEYWMKITDGRGIYWNCNNNKHKYKRLGIGMIHREDAEKRAILLNDVIDYLAKNEQYLRPSMLRREGDKLFVTGLMPKARKRGGRNVNGVVNAEITESSNGSV